MGNIYSKLGLRLWQKISPLELSKSDTQWLGLTILGSGISGNSGWVEFKAVYKDQQRSVEMHEKSVFTLQGNRWFYIGGEVSRNNI